MTTKNLRLIASRVIDAVTDGQSLADCLPPELSKLSETRDRAFVQAICYGVCRYYTRLDVILSHLLKNPMNAKDSDVHALLMVGLYQILDMQTAPHAAVSETVDAVETLKKPWARGLVNAVLRECLRQGDKIDGMIESDAEAAYSHPSWWISSIRKAWPDQWEDILDANNQRPPFSLRVNQQHGTVDEYLLKLADKEFPAHKITGVSHGIILDNPVSVEQLPGFAAGKVTVQDGAAQLATELLELKPGLRVLDACAAPGGKLTHILEIEPTLEVVAVEKSKARLAIIRDNLKRLEQKAECHCADTNDLSAWWDNKPFDRILLDAPCSASGVIRRHPDIKLLRQPTDISALTATQYQMLTTLWQTLAPGGLLVYVTCSVLPEENTHIIKQFLAATSDAKEEIISASWGIACEFGRQILPGMDEMDGFYFACIRKSS
jgi:16S rRNA (cytosine967-C5)-methyltransferase